MTITAGTVVKTSSNTTSLPGIPVADTTTGAFNLCIVSANSTGTNVQPVIAVPAGWIAVPSGDSFKNGSPTHEINAFYRFRQAGDPTTITDTVTATGNIAAGMLGFSPGMIDTATPIVTGESLAAQAAGPTTNVSGAVTLGGSRYVVTGFGNRSGVTWSAAADGNVHDTIQAQGFQSSAASLAICCSGTPTSSGAARSLLSSVSTSINNTVIIGLNPASGSSLTASPADPVGVIDTAASVADYAPTLADPVGITDTATPVLSGSGAASPADPIGVTDSVTVVQTIARGPADTVGVTDIATAITPAIAWVTNNNPMYVAHRGGFASTLGEETLEAYTAAAAQLSTAALEISVWDTSDGVYVCSHDSTTGRVFSGTNRTINSTTWATFSPGGAFVTTGRPTTLVGGNVMRRLEEILDAFPNRIFVVENKHGTNQSTLVTLLQAHCPGRWIFKGPFNDTANANTSSAVGTPCWMYYFPADVTSGNLSGTLTALATAVVGNGVPIIYGLGDYATAPVPVQSDANTFFSFTVSHSLRTWAHILGTTAQRSTADGQASTASSAFTGYMVSGFSAVAPTDNTAPADAVGATDAATAKQDNVRTAADPIGVADASAAVQDAQRGPADAVGVSDSAVLLQTVARGPADPVGATDNAVAAQDASRSSADPVAVTDAGTTVQDTARAPADSVGVADSAGSALAAPRSAANPIGVTDTATPVQDAARTLSDPVAVSDSASASLVGSGAASAADNVGVTDAAAAAQDNARALADGIGVTDQAAATISVSKTAADAVGVTDTSTAAQGATRSPADSVGLTDVVTIVLTSAGVITVDDPVGATDSISTAIAAGRAIAELLAVTDAVLAVLTGEGRDIMLAAELAAQVRPFNAALPVRPPAAALAASRRFHAVLEEQP